MPHSLLLLRERCPEAENIYLPYPDSYTLGVSCSLMANQVFSSNSGLHRAGALVGPIFLSISFQNRRFIPVCISCYFSVYKLLVLPISKLLIPCLRFNAPALFSTTAQHALAWLIKILPESLHSFHQNFWFPALRVSFYSLESLWAQERLNDFCYQTKQNIDSNVNLLENELFTCFTLLG